MRSIQTRSSSRIKERHIRKLLRPTSSIEAQSVKQSNCEGFYTGKSTYGPVGFAASMQSVGFSSVDVSDALHALILGVIELRIQFIENWLQSELDIRPGILEPEANSKLLTIREDESNSELTLYLPVQYWKLIPNFPDQYFPPNWSLKWATYTGNVNLSKLSMRLEEVAKIAAGSMVLIPESFGDRWEASLSISELGVSIPGFYEPKGSNWSANGSMEVLPSESVV